jgi:SSS family transporter
MSAFGLLLLIIGYFGVLQIIALRGRKDSSNAAFFLGNKTSPWYIVAFGMIGASLSGVTFVAVPGWVATSGFSYMQMVLGFSLGYVVVAFVLLPLYYRLQLTSIYTYLLQRFGTRTHKTGSLFFLLSRTIGGATRLYIVALILQRFIFDTWNVPFFVTVSLLLALIYLYTFAGGIKTIVWTDALQTLFLLIALVLLIVQSMQFLSFDIQTTIDTVKNSPVSKVWVFDNWQSPSHFVKLFISGIFITVAMTGLDQDMMQKNLSCKNIQSAQKNMLSYGFAFIPVNLLFLTLGLLLLLVAETQGIPIPTQTDSLLPTIIGNGVLGSWAMVFFLVGIIAATFSSADSALVALTTAFSVDILNIERMEEKRAKIVRQWTHVAFCFLFLAIILLFYVSNNKSILDVLFTIASYTYGPLLGIFAFGIFTKKYINDALVPYIAILSPILAYAIYWICNTYFSYYIGYELLIINGSLTFLGMALFSKQPINTTSATH